MHYLIQTCFCCLSYDNLIDTRNINSDLLIFYKKFINLDQINKNDVGLNHICKKCFKKLNDTDNFWNQCSISKYILSTYISELTSDSEDNNPKDLAIELADINRWITKTNKLKDEEIETDEKDKNVGAKDKISVKRPKNYEDEEIISDSNKRKKKAKKSKSSTRNSKIQQKKDPGSKLNDFTTNTPSNSYQCTHCIKHFPTYKELERHLLIHPKEKIFKCSFCEKICLDRTKFKTHLHSHTEEKSYECPVCFKIFHIPSSLNAHMEVHDNALIRCEFCPKQFQTKHSLTIHQRYHGQLTETNIEQRDETKINCTECPQKFSSQYALKRHKSAQHKKIYECQFCLMKFQVHKYFKDHENKHTENTNFNKCRICSKKYMNPLHLKEHVAECHVALIFSCDHCGKKFNANWKLKRHEGVHDKQE